MGRSVSSSRTHRRTLPQYRLLLESLLVSSHELAEGRTRQSRVIVDEQQDLGSLACDAAVGASPLPLRFPHRKSVWKSRRHLLPKEGAPSSSLTQPLGRVRPK